MLGRRVALRPDKARGGPLEGMKARRRLPSEDEDEEGEQLIASGHLSLVPGIHLPPQEKSDVVAFLPAL
jgi:hypothetical protein